MPDLPRRIGDPLIALAFLVTAGAFLALSFLIADFNAVLFPRVLALAVIAFDVWYLAASVRRTRQPTPPAEDEVGWVQFLVVLGLCVLYVPAMAIAGYLVATAAFIVVGIYLLGYRRPTVVLSVALLVTVGVFVIFKTLMYASLPSSALDDWLMETLYRTVLS